MSIVLLLWKAVEQKRLGLVEVFFSLSESVSSQTYESVLRACAATKDLPAAQRPGRDLRLVTLKL